ncbi:MAG TPA: FtsX-like permease family protein [Candidatus Mediterraneibacter stercoripullorum]|nr:FtsX-like permease family protein [Candidatus Mediterraneibacter stercoripullorum]
MLKLAWKYMKFYRSQTFAIFISIFLTAGLLSGIASLMYSSRQSEIANSKAIYGDWHYQMEADAETYSSVQSGEAGDGYTLEQCGKMEIRDAVSEPYVIYFVYGDEDYREMAHRQLIEGAYPEAENEIAADAYVLSNLGFSGNVGDAIAIGGTEYIVTGILQSEWAASASEMEVFVSDSFIGRGSQRFLYLQFAEDGKLYRQLEAFQRKYGLPFDGAEANDEVTQYLGGEPADSIPDIVRFGLTNEQGKFTYIVLKLESEYNLSYYGMILLLCLFSLFVVYSVFNISASKRTAEYGMMQTLGISEKRIGATLVLELWTMFLIGYPLGCLAGNGILGLCYGSLTGVFQDYGASLTGGAQLTAADQTLAQTASPESGFFVAWDAAAVGFVFLLAALAAAGYVTVYSLRRHSLREVMSGDTSFAGRRKIYAKCHADLAGVVVRKFMFSNKRKVLGILLSLSVYGYDDGMIAQLQDYILEGDVDPARMKAEDQIIAVANVDGQGNYYFYGKKPGDRITLKVLKMDGYTDELLKFQESGEQYIEKEFEIAAIVSRPLAQEDSFMNVDAWSNTQSVILTNEQMEESFGITGYSFVNASPADDAQPDLVSAQLLQVIRDVPKAVLTNYTTAIRTQRNYLNQQQLFFSGIAGIILLYNMFLRRVMDYYMAHVVQFLHLSAGVPNMVLAGVMLLNLGIASAAVFVPARRMLRENVIDEIKI